MVYSCSTFLNEFDLLDLRVSEELDLVDKLVIAEADRTFQGAAKPLHLQGNAKYEHPKVELIAVTDGFVADTWQNEATQRNSLLPSEYDDDDVFIVTDMDEINRKEDLPTIIEQARIHGLVRPRQTHYCFKINLRVAGYRRAAPFAVSGRYLRESGKRFDDFRRSVREGQLLPVHSKHFTYLADAEGISYKLRSFAHVEYNKPEFTDVDRIAVRLANQANPLDHPRELIRVEVDDTYPGTILRNLDYWRKHIC